MTCCIYFETEAVSPHNTNFGVQEGWYDNRPRSFLVYAPSRAAVVYALVDNEPEPAVVSTLVDQVEPDVHSLTEENEAELVEKSVVEDDEAESTEE